MSASISLRAQISRKPPSPPLGELSFGAQENARKLDRFFHGLTMWPNLDSFFGNLLRPDDQLPKRAHLHWFNATAESLFK